MTMHPDCLPPPVFAQPRPAGDLGDSGADNGISVSRIFDGWTEFPDAERVVERSAHAAVMALAPVADARIEIAVALVSDDDIRALNAQFCHNDKATNVLSFPNGMMLAGGPEAVFLGDIAIAYETVVAEAVAEGKDPRHHLAHLTVHGVLHLFGHDHMTDEEAARMETLERSILAGLGVEDPYNENVYISQPEAA